MPNRIERFRAALGTPAGALAAFALLTALLVQSGNLGSVDTRRRLQVARSLWTDESPLLQVDREGYGARAPDGTLHSPYGLGHAVLMLPGDIAGAAVVRVLRPGPERAERIRNLIVILLTFPAVTTACVLGGHRLLVELGFTAREALGGAAGLQLGTSFLHYTQVHQENSLCLALFLWSAVLLARWARTGSWRPAAGAGALMGYALLTRMPTVIDAAFLWAFAVVIGRGATTPRRTILALAAFGLAWLPFLAIDRAYQWYRFGDPWSTYQHYYGVELRAHNPSLPESFPFGYPFSRGFFGALLSPRRSAFLFDPLLLAALYLVARHVRERASLAWVGANGALLVALASFYATYASWDGGPSWANRYTLTPVHGIALVAGAAFVRARVGPLERRILLAILAASVAIQVASILISFNVETDQAVRHVIPQRFVNVVALLTGNFDAWGLSRPGYLETPDARRITLLPFVIGVHATGTLAFAVRLAWLAVLAGWMAAARNLAVVARAEPLPAAADR